MKGPHEGTIEKKCDVCGAPMLVDSLGFGSCDRCGWVNMEASLDEPDYPMAHNFLSLNHARQLYREGKPFKPTFEEFLEVVRVEGEMEFRYRDRVYGVMNEEPIELFCAGIENSTTYYDSLEDFKERAEIDGKLLKDIWDETYQIFYLQ